MFYDFNNNRVIYNPQDSRMFIVACPVEMIVFNDSGEQIASLNGKEDSIIDGFEMMFQTVKIPNSSNDYIKIAIVPNTYTVKLQGTGEGVMNAFTAQITSNGVENINSYFDIPVKSNSVGYFDTSSITTPNVVLDDICYQDVASTTSFSKVIWIIFSVIAITTIAILVVIVFNKKKKSTK